MPRRLITELPPQAQVDQIFLATHKQLRPNRNGQLYLQVELADKSGMITGRLWNASDDDFNAFEDGDYVRVEGHTQLYSGSLQLIVSAIDRVEPDPDIDCVAELGGGQKSFESAARESEKGETTIGAHGNGPTPRSALAGETDDSRRVALIVRQSRIGRHGGDKALAGEDHAPVRHTFLVGKKAVHDHGQGARSIPGQEVKINREHLAS